MKNAGQVFRIAFCGPGEPTDGERKDAETIGFLIGSAGCVLYCGGLGGSMEAAARGAKRAGARTVGILPGYDAIEANQWIDIPVCTGMGHARNAILVASVDAVIGCGGRWGTLSEIALAATLGRPVVLHGTWEGVASISGHDRSPGDTGEMIRVASTPEECVRFALEMAFQGRNARPSS